VLEFDQNLQVFSATAVEALGAMKTETKERIQKAFIAKNFCERSSVGQQTTSRRKKSKKKSSWGFMKNK